MPTTPEGLKTVTLVGQYVLTDDAGTAQQGSLTFSPSPGLITFAANNVMVTGTQTVNLDSTGSFTIDLVCTDTAIQNPTGWTYAVTEKIVGSAPRNFNIFLPYTVAVINLATITPTTAGATYLPVVGPQGPPGVVTFVNGKTGASVTLNSTDVGAVAASAVGAASGIAQLDSGSHVVAAQLAFASATPSAVATAGAVGVGTLVARNDHTHAGVDLTSAQTIGGIKTFSASPIIPDPTTSGQAATKNYTDGTYVALAGAQTVGGIKTFSASPIAPTPTTSTQVAIKSYVDGASTFSGTKLFLQASGASVALATQATGDTNNEFQIQLNGTHSWGTGAAAVDTNLYRAGVAILQTDSTLVVNGPKIIANAGTFQVSAASATVNAFHFFVTGDTTDRLNIRADGKMTWSDGTTADTNLYRNGAGVLMTDSQIQTNNTSILVTRSAGTNPGVRLMVTGDTVDRLNIRADGQLNWGPGGTTAADLFFGRSGVSTATLTGLLSVTGQLTAANFTPAAFTAYTPVWTASGTAPVLSNGTLTGKWAQFGKLIVGEAILTIGSTTTVGTGTYSISLPATSSSTSDYYKGCRGTFGGTTRIGMVTVGSSVATFSALWPTTGTADNSTASGWSATAPAAPVSGDVYRFPFMFEMA